MPQGIIIKGVGGLYSVKHENDYFDCKARGLFRKDEIKPLPGDNVVFEITDTCIKEGYITEILPRKNSFIRPAVSNISQAIIVISVKKPLPDFLLLDKLLCMFQMNDVKCVICINKTDLATTEEINDIVCQYDTAHYKIITASTILNEGIDSIVEVLEDDSTVFAGQSGVGKSSILNKIIGTDYMDTGNISHKIERGKHTTRHAEFIEVFGGFVVDTPGFSNFEAGLLDHKRIMECYKEFKVYENECKFNGCMHINEPGCQVKNAVYSGKIDKRRYDRYVQIYNMADEAFKKKRGY